MGRKHESVIVSRSTNVFVCGGSVKGVVTMNKGTCRWTLLTIGASFEHF